MKALERGLYSKLTGDGTLMALTATATSVYPDVAPQDAALPFIIFSPSGQSTDEYVLGARAFETLDYLVKAVAAGFDPEAANDISERIDALLTNGTVTVAGYTVGMVHRLGRVSYPERGDAGDFFQHRGAVYRFMVDPN
jgi:hypothetical protein